jgi:hypothetical protein
LQRDRAKTGTISRIGSSTKIQKILHRREIRLEEAEKKYPEWVQLMQQLFSQTKVSRYASLPPAPPCDENLSSDTIRRSLRREIERIAKLDHILSDIMRPKALLRRSSSIRFSLILREKIRPIRQN